MATRIESKQFVSGDFKRQLQGYGLTTAQILYRLPDHPALLQTFIWQKFDLSPEFPELHKFLDDMFESMYAAKGVGLAAPQIGVGRKIAVIDVSNGERPEDKLVLINPTIVKVDGKQEGEEGCLSIPGFREQVRRGRSVTIRAQDAKGEVFEKTGEDLLARAFLHETDHLYGKLYITHISALKRDLMKRKIKKLQRAGDWG